MKKERKYSYKNVEMLIAARTLCDNFEDHKPEIVAARAIWADPFIADFKTRINNAIEDYLGLDSKGDLRLATQGVQELQGLAMRDLSLFKVQVEVDFADDPSRLEWIMTHLGFSSLWRAVQSRDQEALIELLTQFKLNLNAALQTEIVNKGMDSFLMDSIKSYAIPIRDANVIQEALKGTSQELTDEAQEEFNGIFSQCMAIAKIVYRLFRDTPVVQKKFSFSRLVKAQNRVRSHGSEPGAGEGPAEATE